MSLTAIITTLITLINYLPKVVDLINKFYSMWVDSELRKVENNYEQIERERSAIVKAISKAESNEDRKALSIILSKLNRM